MADRASVGVRYCGGCNPRYSRVALVEALSEALPAVDFVTAEGAQPYPAVVVVCGCSARCAGVEDLSIPSSRIVSLSGWEGLPEAIANIAQLAKMR